jgi:hypothetical protein
LFAGMSLLQQQTVLAELQTINQEQKELVN